MYNLSLIKNKYLNSSHPPPPLVPPLKRKIEIDKLKYFISIFILLLTLGIKTFHFLQDQRPFWSLYRASFVQENWRPLWDHLEQANHLSWIYWLDTGNQTLAFILHLLLTIHTCNLLGYTIAGQCWWTLPRSQLTTHNFFFHLPVKLFFHFSNNY